MTSAVPARRPLRTRLDGVAVTAPAAPTSAGPLRLAIGLNEAAAALGVSVRTIRRLAAAGALPYARVGSRLLFRLGDLEAFLAARVVQEGS